mgnify:CR=1 FL=1
MASSGSFNTGNYEGRYLQFSWTEKSQNVANNTTTISWTLKGAGTGKVKWYKAGNFKVVIAGETVFSSATRINLYEGTVVASGTYTFKHNADGTKTFSASAEGAIYTNAVNCTGSGNFTLDTIARASQPSCVTYPNHTQNVGEFGDTISIHMNRQSSVFTHTVRYQFGNKSGTIATGVTTGTTWTIPMSLMDLLPTTTYGSGTIYVDTYNGSTLIGTKYCGFTATVPASVKPSCSFTLEDITGVDDIYGSPVKGLSKIKVTVTAKQAYSSPIASCVISVDGVKYSGLTATSGALMVSGTSTVTATIKDKRGRTGSVSYDMNVLNYTAPAVTALTAKRCNQDGTLNKRGAYIKVTFSASVSSMSSKNTAAYRIKYKKSSDTAYTSTAIAALANKYSVSNHTYIFAANLGSSYDVTVEAIDRHYTAQKSTKASTAVSILSWRGFKTSNGKEDGLGIGKVPEKPNTLEVGWDAEFEKELVQKGNKYSFQPDAFSGTKGYILLAVITLNELNVNAPIVFKINRRGGLCPMTVYARFASSSTTTDPDLGSFTYEGDNFGAFMVKSATSVWKLYVDNTSGWSNPCLQEWYTTDNQMSRLTVEFLDEIVEGTEPSALGTYYRAVPAKMQSILDFIYPVGSIYLSYSHVSPAELFGGTWVRIYGAFPWFTDSNGEIGLTGGERTVTLTAAQIPSHNHGGTYTNAGTARTHAWLASGGSAMGYDTVNTGGGEAHNNMPPYIQISAWRRTA